MAFAGSPCLQALLNFFVPFIFNKVHGTEVELQALVLVMHTCAIGAVAVYFVHMCGATSNLNL